jgi:hypothetical protein
MNIFSGGLGYFNVNIQTFIPSLPVQILHERQKTGSLSGLPGRMKHKIFFLVNQGKNFGKIEPLQRRNTVMFFAFNRPCGIEKTFHEFDPFITSPTP